MAELFKAVVPMPIQVVIDDVGWRSGENGHARNEPYRTGIAREHVPADYEAIVDLGRALAMRPQAALVLCEWDRDSILRDVPTTTWMGADWNNTPHVGPWMDEAAAILRANAEHVELALHGVGHEYWQDGVMERAEWHDADGHMRSVDQVEAHLDCFARLIDRHDLGPFPKSFVPAAFLHRFGPSDGHDVSLAELLGHRGITSVSTPFAAMHNAEAVQHGVFGYDAGVMTIDRGNDLLPWYAIGQGPEGELQGPICGLHWPNLLHPDPERNGEVVQQWVRFLRPCDERLDTCLAPDTDAFRAQLAHHVCTRLRVDGPALHIDFSATDRLPEAFGDTPFLLKFDGVIEAPLT
ncbi:MAG TPA: hypothetical protein ENN80_08480, partial [Candidatus Hydrogenedentes bacterium]|nr:hypothetical protein [Candidatus Hydrogenedentota bacterium]